MYKVHKKLQKTFQCKICKKTVSTNISLRRHVETLHHGLLAFKCDLCDKSFKYNQDLKLHTDTIHHGLKFPCDKCARVFDSYSSLYKHKRFQHQKILKFECDICEKKFTDGSQLKLHMIRMHSCKFFKWGPFKCDFCEKDFPERRQLKVHFENCETFTNLDSHKKPFQCDQCSKGFNAKNHLYRHKKFEHLKLLNYECVICEKRLRDGSKLKSHMVVYHSFSVYKCEFCDKDFSAKSILNQHISSIHTEKKHK